MRLAVACGFLLSACGGWDPHDLGERATAAINRAIGYDIIADAPGAIEVNVFLVPEIPPGSDEAHRLGRTDLLTPERYQIILDERMSAAEAPFIIFHEVGHALGLQHSDDPADVMYPESRAVAGYDNDYAQQIARHCAETTCNRINLRVVR